MKIEGTILELPRSDWGNRKEIYDVSLMDGNTTVNASFDAKTYGEEMLLWKRGDHVRAICWFDEVFKRPLFFEPHRIYSIEVSNCRVASP